MARIYTRALREGYITLARGAGTLIGAGNSALAAESATLSDANYPIAQAIDCTGYDSIFVGCDIAAGTTPTMTIEALFRDSEAAVDQRWRRVVLGARDGVTLASLAVENTGPLPPLATSPNMVELRVFGHAFVFLRISAIGGTVTNTTGWVILVKPGQVRPTPGRRFNG